MAVNPRPNLAPDSQPWGRWVTETIRNLEGSTSSTKREIIASSKNHNAQLQLSARQGQMITDVQGELDEANSRLEAAQDLIDELNDITLPGLEGDLTGMQNALDAAEGRLDTAEGELTDLTTNVLPGLTDALDDAQGELSDHATRMTAAEQAVAAAEGRLTAAEGELATLDSDLSQIDTALSDLQTEVDNIVIPSVDGLNKITYSTSAPSATAGYKAGDTWFRYTGTGSSRVIYGQWHFTGSAWNVVALRNEMIASLDAGKITTGFLDAGRIEANTITADKLVVAPGNIFPDPFFRDETAWPVGSSVQVVQDAAFPHGNALQVTTGGSQVGSYYMSRQAQVVQWEPGKQYRVRIRATVSGETGSRLAALAVGPSTSGGTTLTYIPLIPNSEGVTGDTPKTFENTFTARSDWDGAGTIGFYTQSPYVAGTVFRVSDVQVQLMSDTSLIVDGAITGSKIKAGSITATDAVFANGAIVNADIGDLNAAKINAGTLDAARIGANSITASKLIIGSSSNLIPNGAGEAGAATGWAASLTWDTADKPAGEAGSFKQTSGYQTTNDWWDVEPGKPYRFEVWLKADKPNSRIFIECRDQNGSHAGTSIAIPGEPYAGGGSYLVSNQVVPTTWTKYAGIWTPNAGSTRVKIGSIYFNHANGTERGAVQHIAGMRMKPMTGATLIEDGAVTTDKVAANAITGNEIKAGSITASHGVFATGAIQNADIGNLNASKINAGTLNANRIGSKSITGDKIAANTITANHGVFATGAIQAADIGSINANTITVGTLQGINISGTTITGATITGGTLTGTTSISSGGSLTTSGGNFSVTNGSYTIFEANNLGIRIGSYGNSTSRGAISFNGTERGVFISAEEKVSGGWNGVSGASITVGGSTQGWAGASTRYGLSTVSLKAGDLTAPTGTYAIDTPGIRVTHDVKAFSWNDRHPTAMVPNGGNTSYSAVEGSVTRTSDQTISSTSLTQISLTSLNPGSSGVSLAAGGLTGYTRGVYSVEVNIQFDGGSYGSWRNVMLYVNNSEFRRFATVETGSSRTTSFTSLVVVDTDSPSFKLYTNGGGTGMRVNSGVTMYVTRIGG